MFKKIIEKIHHVQTDTLIENEVESDITLEEWVEIRSELRRAIMLVETEIQRPR